MSWTRGLVFPGSLRDNAYSKINMKNAGAEGVRTHHINISFQGGRGGERDGGLLHVEEYVLDVSAPHGADRVSLRNWALQQPLDGFGDLCDALKLLGSHAPGWSEQH